DAAPRTAARLSEAGPAPKRVVAGFGFWGFLLRDLVMFSALFATYAVLAHAPAGGPAGAPLFRQRAGGVGNAGLLASGYSFRVMSLAVNRQRIAGFYLGALVTFVLGACFLGLEVREFANMIAEGATPQRSAFLSSFFPLVGCHGLHVTAGLIW